MKYRLEIWIFCLLSSLFFIVDIEASDILYPEDNVGMLYGYTPGLFTSTDSPTDLAIDGNGFFILRNSKSEDVFHTKVGNFVFDSNDYLVSSHGYIVQGWELTEEGEVVGAVTEIQIPFTYRSNISINENGKIFEQDSFDTLIPLYQVALSQFYDPHRLEEIEVNLFQETSDSGAATANFPGAFGMGTIANYSLEEIDSDFSYEADILVDGVGYFVVRAPDNENQTYYAAYEKFRLNRDGQLVSSEDMVAQGWELATNDTSGETERIGSVSDIEFSSFTIADSDYSAQALTRVLIDGDGIITAYYSEGLVMPCFQIALASFEDESELNEIDTGLFEETSDSGSPTASPPNENEFGSLVFNGPGEDVSGNGGCFINQLFQSIASEQHQ